MKKILEGKGLRSNYFALVIAVKQPNYINSCGDTVLSAEYAAQLFIENHSILFTKIANHFVRQLRKPLLERQMRLKSEYDIPVHEVCLKKKKITDSIPVHLSGI